jgi:hypothetical protein
MLSTSMKTRMNREAHDFDRPTRRPVWATANAESDPLNSRAPLHVVGGIEGTRR